MYFFIIHNTNEMIIITLRRRRRRRTRRRTRKRTIKDCEATFLVRLVAATDADHRPAVFFCVGHASDCVNHARASDCQATTRTTGEVANGSSGIGSSLFVAHTDVLESSVLHGCGKINHGISDDAEHLRAATIEGRCRRSK